MNGHKWAGATHPIISPSQHNLATQYQPLSISTHPINNPTVFYYPPGTMSGRLGSVGEVGIGCKAYNASAVYFATKNWTAEYLAIEKYREGILKTVLNNGTLLKPIGGDDVYMVLLYGSDSIPKTPR